jgi:serine phosphatase RsbU (regulator of sigma subunit)
VSAAAGRAGASAQLAGTAGAQRSAHHSGRRRAARPRAAPAPSGPAQAPLLRTITRIIGVVPQPLRVLLVALGALALAALLALRLLALRARRLERQRRQLAEDVGLLQAALLPTVPEQLGPVRATVAYRPAEGPGAGGDFYDAWLLPDGQLGVILGDLSGHGRRALPHTALVRFTLRAHLEAGLSPRLALQSAAPVLDRQLGGSFATVVLARYQPSERRLTYAAAGHPPPLILGAGVLRPLTVCSSPPIGLDQPTGLRQTVVELPGQATICFYTDGLMEARGPDGRFGTRGLERCLAELGAAGSATELLRLVVAQTVARSDDMAACVLQLHGDGTPPRVLVEELELPDAGQAAERLGSFLSGCGVAAPAIATARREAVAQLRRGASVVVAVRLAGEQPEVSVSRGEVARFPRASGTAVPRRRMAT